MTQVLTTPAVATPRTPLRRGMGGRREVWPIWIAIPGLLAFWALGLGGLARLAMIVPMATRLLMMRNIRTPPRFWILVAFVGWVFLSSMQLPPRSIGIFLLLRGSEYIAILLAVVFIYNIAPLEGGDGSWLRRPMLWLWLGMIVLGLLALALPGLQLPSLVQTILPGSIVRQDFVRQLTTPALAQVQPFLGFPLPRPSGPFSYANGWGAAMALLMPFSIGTAVDGPPKYRKWARIGLLVSVIPVVLSVNRAMWGSLIIGMSYLVVAARDPALKRGLTRAVAAALLILSLASISPLGSLVATRLSTPHSNNARSDLAVQAGERALDKPLFGYGAPVEFEGAGIRPPVGTQGQVWLIMISNGIPALILYLAYFGSVFPLLKGPRMGPSARASIVSMGVVMPFYSLLGGQLFILCAGIAAAQREVDILGAAPRHRAPL